MDTHIGEDADVVRRLLVRVLDAGEVWQPAGVERGPALTGAKMGVDQPRDRRVGGKRVEEESTPSGYGRAET